MMDLEIAYETMTPLTSLAGGVLIGLSASLMLLVSGRVAGISGIVGGLMSPNDRNDARWRVAFVAGLVAAGALMGTTLPALFAGTIERSTPALVAAGLLVG